jgi:Putative beta-barrel porin-2, OmpL-like. bbp2
MAIASLAFAQDQPAPAAQAPAPAPAPAAPPAPTWSIGPIDFSGMIDGYYTFNFNHPFPTSPPPNNLSTGGGNQLYNFNVDSQQFSLSMAKLTLSHDADPFGFRMDIGYGKAFDIIHFAEPSGAGFLRNIEQADVSMKNKKGFELDAGQFVTSAGAEVIESKDNWNYSRSLLFSWAIPYYHFGVRAVLPVGSHFTGGVQLVNGWNNTEDNNTGKTLVFVGNFTTKKLTWSNNYITGPENTNSNKGFRNLYDTTLLFTPSDKFNAYINYDYGRNGACGTCAAFPGSGSVHWDGIAVAGHLQLNSWFALSPRYEYFDDANGFQTVATPGWYQEFTITAEAKASQGVMTRLEYRHDWAENSNFFQKGLGRFSDHQDTISLAIIAFFGPKH